MVKLRWLKVGDDIRQNGKFILGFLLALVLCATSVAPVRAGDGEIDGNDLKIKVLFLYDESDLNSWKPLFTEASKLLWNATEGNLKIGEVCFYRGCQAAKDKTDIWIRSGSFGASAHVGGLGTSGLHVFLSELHKSTTGTAHGQFGLVHELGHYVFSLTDEYGGCIKTADQSSTFPPPSGSYMWKNSDLGLSRSAGDSVFYCTTRSGGSACLMDGGTTVSANHARTEFCTAADHVGGYLASVQMPGETTPMQRYIENHQECQHNCSCWEMVASVLGISVPSTISTTMPSGHSDPTFEDCGANVRFMLAIDRSGSMCWDMSKLNLAKAGARNFVSLAKTQRTEYGRTLPGDELGVVAFDCSITVPYALQEMISETEKMTARYAIDTISCGGATSIGGGLRTALNQLEGTGTLGCAETIVLLSDGMHNCGEAPSAVLPDLGTRGVRVYTVGVGSDADTAMLQNIASSTEGKFYFAATSADIPTIFVDIQSQATGADVVDKVKAHLEEGEEETISIPIDGFTSEVTFSLVGEGFEMMLKSPSGNIIPPLPENVEYFHDSDFQYFRVHSPESGTWQAIIRATSAGDYALVATADSLEVDVDATGPSGVLLYPQPMLVEVRVMAAGPLSGAQVTGTVLRPDGSNLPVVFLDNGEQGDLQAGDGVYSLSFDEYNEDGVYTCNIVVRNIDGYIIPDEETPGRLPIPVEPFQRTTSVTAQISGVPEVTMVTIDIKPDTEPGPHAIATKSKGVIPVTILSTEVFDATQIDVSTLVLDGDSPGSPGTPGIAHKKGHLEDVNGDGRLDLIVHFPNSCDGIVYGDTKGIVTGYTLSDIPIHGECGIRTVN